jgi:hypothetical protein
MGEPKSSKALKRVLKTPEEFSSTILYVSCGVALRLHHLEDAGFLFYIAHIREQFDKVLFPPSGTGENETLRSLRLLHAELGTQVSPALMSEPKIFTHVLAKVKSWKPRVAPTLEPGWEYLNKGSEAQAEKAMADAREDLIAHLSELAALLQDADYFAAFRTAQDYNRKLPSDANRPTKEAYESACQVMEKIELERSIIGFATFIRTRSEVLQPAPR